MKPFISNEFYNYKDNPFHLEKEDQFKYKLTSLIVYSSSDPTKEGYITYVRHKDNLWLRFSKFNTSYISQSEVENIKFPYILIYNRDFEIGNERSNIRSQLDILKMTGYGTQMRYSLLIQTDSRLLASKGSIPTLAGQHLHFPLRLPAP